MRQRVVIAVFSAVLATAVQSSADPVRIASGAFTGSDSDVNDFAMFGSGLSLTGIIAADANKEPHARCLPCAPGSPLSLSSGYIGRGEIQAIIGGTTFTDVAGTFQFNSSTILIPDIGPDDRAFIQRPFTFTGTLTGFTGGSAAFTRTLIGSGIATLEIAFSEGEGINPILTRYDFTPGGEVPEPASLVLLMSGLAGLVARRRALFTPRR